MRGVYFATGIARVLIVELVREQLDAAFNFARDVILNASGTDES